MGNKKNKIGFGKGIRIVLKTKEKNAQSRPATNGIYKEKTATKER